MTRQQLFDALLPVRMTAPAVVKAPDVALAILRDKANRPYLALTIEGPGGGMTYEVDAHRELLACPYHVARFEQLGFVQRITHWGTPA